MSHQQPEDRRLLQQQDRPWYEIANIDQLDTPALVVYPDRVKENIRRAVGMTGDAARLRPHVKTHKSPAVTRLMLEAGILKFKCATIAEAEMLAIEGAPDVLLAYQPIGPKVIRLAALIQKFPATKFACLIDNVDAAAVMAQVFTAAGLVVPVYLDLNVGMDRTGIAPGPEALALYKTALALDGIHPVGLHAYDGHIRDTDPILRRQKCDAAFTGVIALRAQIGALPPSAPSAGSPAADLTIIAGGSPTFPIHAGRAADIQCSPGTFVYWDKGYGDQFPDQPFTPDALVITRVISLRGDTRLCLDLGHKSISAENELDRRVFFLNAPGFQPVSQSEEHLVVEAGPGHGYSIGDVFYGVPFHVCPTVALYERAITIEGGRFTGGWKNVARDRMLTV
jgi:D-serine deaminase-like pyridoxal phosphate-dependent protein